MCRNSAPPGYVRSKPPERPKLGQLVPVIEAILESDKTAPPKQRHELRGKVSDGVNRAADLISATAFDSVFELYTVDDFRQLVLTF